MTDTNQPQWWTEDDVETAARALYEHWGWDWAEDVAVDDRVEIVTDFRLALIALSPAVERIRRAAAAEARKAALAEAIQAHRNLHIVYGSTAVCHGGIGGQAMTEHCGQTCHNPVHDDAKEAWEAVELAYFEPDQPRPGRIPFNAPEGVDQ